MNRLFYLLWIRCICSSGPSHSCWLKAELSLRLLRFSHAVIFVSTGLFSSFSEQWPPAVTRRRGSRRVWRKPGRRSRCGAWRPKRTGASEGTFTDHPRCTCRWSALEAETMLRHCTSSPSSTGKLYTSMWWASVAQAFTLKAGCVSLCLRSQKVLQPKLKRGPLRRRWHKVAPLWNIISVGICGFLKSNFTAAENLVFVVYVLLV